MNRKDIDQKYIQQAQALEEEFFEIVDKGKPSQHRVLKSGKTIEEFNQRHAEIWESHHAELVEAGLAAPETSSTRDLAGEIDQLKTRLANVEKKIGIISTQ